MVKARAAGATAPVIPTRVEAVKKLRRFNFIVLSVRCRASAPRGLVLQMSSVRTGVRLEFQDYSACEAEPCPVTKGARTPSSAHREICWKKLADEGVRAPDAPQIWVFPFGTVHGICAA